MRNFNLLEPMQHCCDYQLAEIFALLKVYIADYLQGYTNPESTEEAR